MTKRFSDLEPGDKIYIPEWDFGRMEETGGICYDVGERTVVDAPELDDTLDFIRIKYAEDGRHKLITIPVEHAGRQLSGWRMESVCVTDGSMLKDALLELFDTELKRAEQDLAFHEREAGKYRETVEKLNRHKESIINGSI